MTASNPGTASAGALGDARTERNVRPFSDLLDSGMLLLINASTYHPRGVAMAILLDDAGVAVGWYLVGEGDELWQFGITSAPDPAPDSIDGRWRASQATIAEAIADNVARRNAREAAGALSDAP